MEENNKEFTISELKTHKEGLLAMIKNEEEQIKERMMNLFPGDFSAWKVNEAEYIINNLLKHGRYISDYRDKETTYQECGCKNLDEFVKMVDKLKVAWAAYAKIDYSVYEGCVRVRIYPV